MRAIGHSQGFLGAETRVDRRPSADSRGIPVVFRSNSRRIPVEFRSNSRRVPDGSAVGPASRAGPVTLPVPRAERHQLGTVRQYNMPMRISRTHFAGTLTERI